MNKKPSSKLWLYFTGTVFATIFAVFLVISLLWAILFRLDMVEIVARDRHIPILIFALGSMLLGTVITFCVGKLIIRPIQNMGMAFDRLSRGDFSVRVSEKESITEIRDMARRFNAMTYDLSHMETLRSDFVANVSHEFKTPIAAIQGYATLLQDPNLTGEKRQHYVERILENSRRLSSLSGNILLLSRLENQEMVLDKTEYRLDEQIRRCILTLEGRWTQKRLELDVELPRRLYEGSEPLLEQVWLNLLDNAIKYSPECGCIAVRMTEREGVLRVSVSDQGEGMTEEVRRHIFEKFYQGDASHRAEGNGLGLALVKRIVDLCRGRVLVSSAPGQGTVFTVELPLP